MRALLASDLHFEFHRDGGEAMVNSLPDADVLICPGDLDDSIGIEDSLRLLCSKWPEVVFVCGNHEFYQGSIAEVRRRLVALAQELPNLHYLENEVCEIQGVRFVGTTMWFRHFEGIGPRQRYLNDFHVIKDATHKAYEENEAAIEFLKRETTPESVVVTHHLPAEICVKPRFKGSLLNAFFLCDMEDLIRDRQPRVWVHGHTHDSVDEQLGQTRILCNPFGYARHEINPGFREDMIIEL